jgi:hypothetical protein
MASYGHVKQATLFLAIRARAGTGKDAYPPDLVQRARRDRFLSGPRVVEDLLEGGNNLLHVVVRELGV